MVMRSSPVRCGFGAFLLSCSLAGAASAAPLLYHVVASESDVSLSTQVTAIMDVNPDFTNTFPTFGTLVGASDTMPTNDSKVTADVGLPNNFNPAGGIDFSNLSIVLQELPGQLEGFGLLPVSLNLLGTNVQFVAFFAHLSSFRIDLDDPFSSSLTPTGNPNEWAWAGLANVTISGALQPLVQIPTQGDVSLGTFPFSQQVTVPLFGTFSGDGTGTKVAVGLQQGALQDQDLSLPLRSTSRSTSATSVS